MSFFSPLARLVETVKRAAEFVLEHAGLVRTFVERLVDAVRGLLRLDWRGEPVAAAGLVAVAAVQAIPSLTDASLSILERAVAAAMVFASAIAASTRTRAKVALPKKYQGS